MSPQETPCRRCRRRLLKAGGFVLAGLLGLAALWVAGFVWFATTLPARVEDEHSHTDAIVVLTGGSERLTTGLALLQAGLARQLFISGVHRGVEIADILKLANNAPPELAATIALGHVAGDTVGNAAETAQWATRHDVRSLRLVTGAYHMPRSLTELGYAMPDVAIVPHPVFPEGVKSQEWWRWPGTAALLATEYTKYLAAVARHWFLPRKSAP